MWKMPSMVLIKGKSLDILGITAEHIQYGGDITVQYIFNIFEYMLKNRLVPDDLKVVILTPILKKKKDPKNPAGYRGITILLTFEKIFEKVWLSKCKPLLDARQKKMQRGFTENTSSINTGLLLTEFKNESKEKKTPVFAVTLDGQIAFHEV